MNMTFDRYHDYEEVRRFLDDCVKEHPSLCRVEVIGKSYQGRDILMLEITNHETGPGEDKPAIYADGNTHAGEVTGCEVILYTIKHILDGYGKDPQITFLVDTRTFYFVPRITVDGSEYYLSTPYMLRSSLHPWPQDADEKPGLYPEDIDGNGKILTMRVKDPDGGWKVSDKDPRLMVRRRPDEIGKPGETYYNLYVEGLIKEFDGDLPIKQQPSRFGIDFNRQYPTNWAVYTRQRGSGDYPFSEPEMKAIGDFYLSHPNIVSSMSYHTSGGYVLRPLCTEKDGSMDSRDLDIYLAIGEIAGEVTGYPCKSVFEWFTYDQKKPEVGSDLEWVYETLGVLAFETELWDMRGRAGIPKKPLSSLRTMSWKDREEEELKILKWNDEVMGGRLFNPWKPFEHPQLGEVEIGGWEPKFGRQNPPPELLEEECRKNALFNLTRAAITPRLAMEKVKVTSLGGGFYKVEVVVKNEGYLPSHATFQALKMKQAKPVRVLLEGVNGEPGPVLVSGKEDQEIGHLGGRAGGGDPKQKISWVVRGKEGDKFTIVAHTPRAGKVRAEVCLR